MREYVVERTVREKGMKYVYFTAFIATDEKAVKEEFLKMRNMKRWSKNNKIMTKDEFVAIHHTNDTSIVLPITTLIWEK